MTATGGTPSSSTDRASAWGPLLFVPTAYFLQGLPYNVVSGLAPLWLLDLGVEKTWINAITGALLLTWSVKPLWAPLVDARGTKRRWTLGMEALGALLLALLALASWLPGPALIPVATGLLAVAALASATHDIALDGFYMLALEARTQAALSGLRVAAWRLSLIFVGGALVAGVGALRARLGWSVASSWAAGLAACAAITAALALLHAALFPRPDADRPVSASAASPVASFRDAFASLLGREDAWRLVLFIVFARFAEALLGAMARLFLRDPIAKGGLGCDLETVGWVYGTVGVVALLAGGITGGIVTARLGLRRALWPLFLALNVPDLVYVYLAREGAGASAALLALLVGVEQAGYGLGSGAFAVVLLRAARPPFRTTQYALMTGIMTLTVSLATLASGPLQARLGYEGYFWLVCAAAVPSVLSVLLLRGVALEEDLAPTEDLAPPGTARPARVS